MASTASERLQKRRINELEQKLKKLQREIRAFKVEKKQQIGHLRKQATRAAQAEAEYHEILEELDADVLERMAEQKKKKPTYTVPYKCKNSDCINVNGFENPETCTIIEAGSRLIIVCQDCGKRYSIEAKASQHH